MNEEFVDTVFAELGPIRLGSILPKEQVLFRKNNVLLDSSYRDDWQTVTVVGKVDDLNDASPGVICDRLKRKLEWLTLLAAKEIQHRFDSQCDKGQWRLVILRGMWMRTFTKNEDIFFDCSFAFDPVNAPKVKAS
jgi:hypothetical protein